MNRMAEPDMREALKPLLRGRDKDALVDFLLNSAMYDSSLAKHILIAFSDDVQSLLHHWGSRLGTAVSQLTQNSFGEVCLADQGENVIEECLSEIDFAIHYKRLLYAVDLLKVLEEATQTLEGIEWNAGEVRNRMEALADAIGTVEIEDEERLQLVQYLWEDCRDWELGLHVLVGLIKGDEEIECVRKAVEEDDSLSVFWISLLLRFALYEELDVFLSSPECQACWYTIAIEDALKAGSYVRVITLSQRALERFSRITLWDTYLYDASIKAGRDDITRELAFRYAAQGSFSHIEMLKKLTEAEHWDAVVQQLMEVLEKNSQATNTYARFLCQEGKTERLMALVRDKPFLFDDYYDHLLPRYTAELKMHMTEYCKTLISHDGDRTQCKVLVQKLLLLKDLGWEDEVQSLRGYFLGKYPAKRMLKQELQQARLL